jgi:hypothetical protein
VKIVEQRITARITVFIVISGLEPMREITAGPSSPLESPVVRTIDVRWTVEKSAD